MNDETCRFVDHDQRVVLIDDHDRNSLRCRHSLHRRRNHGIDCLTGDDAIVRFAHHTTVDAHTTGFDECFDTASAKALQCPREIGIQSPAGCGSFDRDLAMEFAGVRGRRTRCPDVTGLFTVARRPIVLIR